MKPAREKISRKHVKALGQFLQGHHYDHDLAGITHSSANALVTHLKTFRLCLNDRGKGSRLDGMEWASGI